MNNNVNEVASAKEKVNVKSLVKGQAEQFKMKYVDNNVFKVKYYQSGIYADKKHKKNYINLSEEDKLRFQKLTYQTLQNLFVYRHLARPNNCTGKFSVSLCWNCDKACFKKNMKPCKWHSFSLPQNVLISKPKSETFEPNTSWIARPTEPEEGIKSYCVHYCDQFKLVDPNRRSGWTTADLTPVMEGFLGVHKRTFLRRPQEFVNLFNDMFPFMNVQISFDTELWENEEFDYNTRLTSPDSTYLNI